MPACGVAGRAAPGGGAGSRALRRSRWSGRPHREWLDTPWACSVSIPSRCSRLVEAGLAAFSRRRACRRALHRGAAAVPSPDPRCRRHVRAGRGRDVRAGSCRRRSRPARARSSSWSAPTSRTTSTRPAHSGRTGIPPRPSSRAEPSRSAGTTRADATRCAGCCSGPRDTTTTSSWSTCAPRPTRSATRGGSSATAPSW